MEIHGNIRLPQAHPTTPLLVLSDTYLTLRDSTSPSKFPCGRSSMGGGDMQNTIPSTYIYQNKMNNINNSFLRYSLLFSILLENQ